MTAPISFTDKEHEALDKVDDLSKAIIRVSTDIVAANRRIVREKAKKDQLIARKETLEKRIRAALELIDTAKNRARVP